MTSRSCSTCTRAKRCSATSASHPGSCRAPTRPASAWSAGAARTTGVAECGASPCTTAPGSAPCCASASRGRRMLPRARARARVRTTPRSAGISIRMRGAAVTRARRRPRCCVAPSTRVSIGWWRSRTRRTQHPSVSVCASEWRPEGSPPATTTRPASCSSSPPPAEGASRSSAMSTRVSAVTRRPRTWSRR